LESSSILRFAYWPSGRRHCVDVAVFFGSESAESAPVRHTLIPLHPIRSRHLHHEIKLISGGRFHFHGSTVHFYARPGKWWSDGALGGFFYVCASSKENIALELVFLWDLVIGYVHPADFIRLGLLFWAPSNVSSIECMNRPVPGFMQMNASAFGLLNTLEPGLKKLVARPTGDTTTLDPPIGRQSRVNTAGYPLLLCATICISSTRGFCRYTSDSEPDC
ncbi:hypothetical protein SUGI_0882600, partial [Cryptomeria japonica]